MNQLELDRYINPHAGYDFTLTPSSEPTGDTNCLLVVHDVAKDRGNPLPPDMLCADLYTDRVHARPVEETSPLQAGDLFWFGQDTPRLFKPEYDENGWIVNWTDSPLQHVGIYTGRNDAFGEPLILHATQYEGTVAVWPLARFATQEKYRRQLGISRLKTA
jgi:hypothetical protein